LSISYWEEDRREEAEFDAYFLPTFIIDFREVDVIPIPRLSSLAFVFPMDKFKQYNLRFAFGMSNVYCSASNVNLNVSPQSVSCIIYDCISRISAELHRV